VRTKPEILENVGYRLTKKQQLQARDSEIRINADVSASRFGGTDLHVSLMS